MAHKFKNDKGFLIIKTENLSEVLKLGGAGICDSCNNSSFTGYYIAVLNRWYCEKCFDQWYSRAIYYAEDAEIEKSNFNYYAQVLGVKND